jgi:hypothetical protein
MPWYLPASVLLSEKINVEPQSHLIICRHEAVPSALQPKGHHQLHPRSDSSFLLSARRYSLVLSTLRSLMPTSRILLLGLLPRFDIYTLPGVPGLVFKNQTQVLGGLYDKGVEQVC